MTFTAWKHTERKRHRKIICNDFMRFCDSSIVRNLLKHEAGNSLHWSLPRYYLKDIISSYCSHLCSESKQAVLKEQLYLYYSSLFIGNQNLSYFLNYVWLKLLFQINFCFIQLCGFELRLKIYFLLSISCVFMHFSWPCKQKMEKQLLKNNHEVFLPVVFKYL